MTVLEFILSPFIFIIRELFQLSYHISANLGFSIILLSFGISVLLLPIFIIIEKAKRHDDSIKLKMKPLLDEIKRCYKGQERYYYIKTINRQHNYSPLKALIPILSLLLQIPFFIAAYQFLENYEPLAGEGFLFIKDLSAPDGVLGSVNILPIAMTLINLLTAYFYTRNGNTAERKQMLIVAGIFLVLLFNLPAGLVLYWTMNNVFSFLRLFITNREVFKKVKRNENTPVKMLWILKGRFIPLLPKLKITFIITSTLILLRQLNVAHHHSITDNLIQLVLGIGFSFFITLAIGLLSTVHKVEGDVSLKRIKEFFVAIWPTYKTLFFILLTGVVYSQINWILLHNSNSMVQRLSLSLVGTALFTTLLATFLLYLQGKLTLSTGTFQYKITDLGQPFKTAFRFLLAISLSGQLIWATYNHYQNIILKLSLSLVSVWLFIVILGNTVAYIKRYRALSLKDIKQKIRIAPKIFYSLSFLSLYFFLAGTFYFTGTNTSLIFIAFLFSVPGQVMGSLYINRRKRETPYLINRLAQVVSTTLILIQLCFLLAFLFNLEMPANVWGGFFSQAHQAFPRAVFAGILVNLISIPYYANGIQRTAKIPEKSIRTVFLLAVFYVLSAVFFWSPLMVYSSFPETFSFPAIEVFTKNFFLFALSFGFFALAYLLIPKKYKHLFTVLCVTLALVSFLYTNIFPIHVGTLQLGQYIEAGNLAKSLGYYFLEGFFLMVAFTGLQWLLYKAKYIKFVSMTLVFLTLIFITESLITGINKGDFFTKDTSGLNLPNNLSFSKNKKNVVCFLPDMFLGMHMKYILEEAPELKNDFEGFVWYPNTLSVSTNTTPSISSLMGGFDYTPEELNKDASSTMTEKITAVSKQFSAKIKSKGYQLTSTDMVFSEIEKDSYDAYLPVWHSNWNKWNNTLHIGGTKELDFTILWKNALFYSIPLFLKPGFYDHGKWIDMDNETNKNSILTQRCNFIRLMPYISDTLSKTANFMYIHSEATHLPWNIVDDNGKLFADVPSYENHKWFIHEFTQWLEWMKKNDVYDNTKIVIVSDHGPDKTEEELKNFGGAYRWNEAGQDKISSRHFWRVNALMMVKDFNARGALKEDWRLMSNADTPAIVFDENDPTKIKNPESRTLPVFFVDYERRNNSKKQLTIQQQFLVKDSIYDPQNWTIQTK